MYGIDGVELQSNFFKSKWRDVTQVMSTAANEFKVGQLAHEDDFNLFESMSALELMDPKMDSGMLVNGAPMQSISARLENCSLQLEFSSARDVLATLDALFCCEMGWLDGLPLAQSLLTSVYTHRDSLNALCAQLVTPLENLVKPDADIRLVLTKHVGKSAKDSLLLVMCAAILALLKTADLVRDAALRADIYEEEDFSPGKGFDLGVLAPLSEQAIDTLLQVTLERLEGLLVQHKNLFSKKTLKKKQTKKVNTASNSNSKSISASGYEMLHQNARIGAMLCEALIRRIQLRRELLTTYAGIGLAEGALDLQHARNGFEAAIKLIQEIATERIELDPECLGGKPIGFDPGISRLLLSGSPPRDVKVPSIDEALELMKKILSEMVVGCSPPNWRCIEDLRIFLTQFSRQLPTIVARSYVLLFLYADSKIYGKYNFMDWMTASMVMNGVPSVLLSTQEGVLYSSRCIETVYESLKVYLHNRSRQRPRIECLLNEWSILQAEATAVDERFTTEMNIPRAAHPRYFTSWSLEEAVQLMLHYVVLGLELELYLDYLEGTRLQNLDGTWALVEKMMEIMPAARLHEPLVIKQTHVSGKATKKSKAKSKKSYANHTPKALGPPRDLVDPIKARFLREIKYTELLRSLMRGYFQVFHALEREGLVQVKVPIYSTLALRFQHRFAAFQKVHYPAALTFEDYSQNSNFSLYEIDLIYKSSEECFKSARVHAEALLNDEEGVNTIATTDGEWVVRGLELPSLLKVCISNCVRLAQRSGCMRKMTTSENQMDFDFSIHPHFPILIFPSLFNTPQPRFVQPAPWRRRALSVFSRSTLLSPRSRALHLQATKASIEDAIAKEKALVFSKTQCPFCARVKNTLEGLKVNHQVIELDTRDDGTQIQSILLEITGQRTVPNVFINGKHIGGCDDIMLLHAKSELAPLLQK
ncbi:hypothetical protein CCR75_000131 [Bremia lactucae]|uniref:Glutaredoxin n=1 Tax=Bremia lactucae TaxID=4779 RepID=A0A976IEH2_BRELC|nr:hypothetical protein CCR75_000131 [Bremia lactucae]